MTCPAHGVLDTEARFAPVRCPRCNHCSWCGQSGWRIDPIITGHERLCGGCGKQVDPPDPPPVPPPREGA